MIKKAMAVITVITLLSILAFLSVGSGEKHYEAVYAAEAQALAESIA